MRPERGRLLLGAFDSAAAAVELAARVTTADVEWIRASWPLARAAFLASSAPEPTGWQDLDPALERELTERMQAPLFQSALNGMTWRFRGVRIRALRTWQPVVSLDRVGRLAGKLANGLTAALFPLETSMQVSTRAEAGCAVVVADRPELVVSALSIDREPGTGAFEIKFRVEARPNYVSATPLGDGALLRNGNHRLLAALSAEVDTVPCVVVDGVVEPRADRFSLSLLSAPRPPCLIDFARPSTMTLDVDLRPRSFVTIARAEQRTLYTT